MIKLLSIFSITVMIITSASTANERGPKETIDALFDAMRAGDKTALLALWAVDNSGLRRVTAKGEIKPDGLKGWSNWVGTLKKGDADEKIFSVKTQQFGNMATVWAPFKIVFKGKLVGCGVNTFTLAKVPDSGWKIIHGMDTNHAGDCTKF